MTKACTKCKVVRPHTEFTPDYKNTKTNRASQCLACTRATYRRRMQSPEFRETRRTYAREYRQRNTQVGRNTHMKIHYGITLEIYNQMKIQQHNLCAICKDPSYKPALAVDHCHATGNVRGLLCARCNTGLGMFKDNPDFLKAAIIYVEKSGKS